MRKLGKFILVFFAIAFVIGKIGSLVFGEKPKTAAELAAKDEADKATNVAEKKEWAQCEAAVLNAVNHRIATDFAAKLYDDGLGFAVNYGAWSEQQFDYKQYLAYAYGCAMTNGKGRYPLVIVDSRTHKTIAKYNGSKLSVN